MTSSEESRSMAAALKDVTSYQSINSTSALPEYQQRWNHPRQLSHNQYEEIVSWVECPTCKGSGKISKESEEEYIALIPLSDERLRPRRTLRYVGVTFIACIVLVVILIVFLMPRSIVLSSDYPYITPTSSQIRIITDKTLDVDMVFANKVNLTNYNFYNIAVTQVLMDIYIGNTKLESPMKNTVITVPLRSTRQLSMIGNLTLKSSKFQLVYYCKFDDFILRTIYMRFTFTVSSSFFGQTTQSTLRTTQGIDCYSPNNFTLPSAYSHA